MDEIEFTFAILERTEKHYPLRAALPNEDGCAWMQTCSPVGQSLLYTFSKLPDVVDHAP